MALTLVLGFGLAPAARAAEPDAKSYWDVDEIRPGMKGVGRTVLVGTKVEEFGAEVLGVMRDVSPGRDMVLVRLKGCQLEHSGIVQGMSGSPIYIDGKLLGAVAFGWEFGKDPIAGVTPFSQMVRYARAHDRRLAAEARDRPTDGPIRSAALDLRAITADGVIDAPGPVPAAGVGLAGMRPIATPLAASGFSPRALAILADRLGPIGLAPMAGGRADEKVVEQEGDKPLVPGAPLSVAMVTGDFDISGVGTVTHVEGDRVYGFGHPMFGLGACKFPMMTGYIHTVYPRASVSMKLSSPLKVVGVLDTDVSTGVAGRVGSKPDMLPMSVKVKAGRYSEPRTYRVQVVREPDLLATLVLSVLANAIDTEGNLPDELSARLRATIKVDGHDPIVLDDTFSGARYSGPMGPTALFGPVAGIVQLLARNPMAPVRIESIDCDVDIAAGRTSAEIESVRLASDRVEPGQDLRVTATLKPFKGERQAVELALRLPDDLPEGTYEAVVCDASTTLRRAFRNDPQVLEPRDLAGVLKVIQLNTKPKRQTLYLHVPRPEAGLAVEGQSLPNLPGSVRAALADRRQTASPPVRTDLTATAATPWVVEGAQSLRFRVVKDDELSK
jgi:hypothetical protein